MKLFNRSDRVDRVVGQLYLRSSGEELALEETKIELLGEEADLVHVRLIGRLDTAGMAQVETRFTAMISPRGKHALVDISEVSFLASMTMGFPLTPLPFLIRTSPSQPGRLASAASASTW
jgi:hypothetical protein